MNRLRLQWQSVVIEEIKWIIAFNETFTYFSFAAPFPIWFYVFIANIEDITKLNAVSTIAVNEREKKDAKNNAKTRIGRST